MTVRELTNKLNLKVLAGESGLDKEITGYYICDLLSWVMAHSSKGNAWMTIHTHLNVVAVAVLVELSCIIVLEDIQVEEQTLEKANEEGIPILAASLNSFQLSCCIERIEKNE
jgi:predicted transcriptional regulator